MTEQWPTRAVQSEDEFKYILDTWISSYRDSPWAGCIPNNVFPFVTEAAIKQLLERGAQLRVAYNPERETQLLGWMCTETTRTGENVIHYAFTKSDFRKIGVFSSLKNASGITGRFAYTYRTRDSKYIATNAVYAPMIARRKVA